MENVNLHTLNDQLFKAKLNSYAVIDGAALPALLGKLEDCELEYTCLFRGELPFDLAEAAPYLVRLEKDNNFTSWLLSECTEVPCCIFAQSIGSFLPLRKHFRSFLKVNSPDGKILHFRYYDPRVLETYLPTCIDEDYEILFKDISSYLVFNKIENHFITYSEEILRELRKKEQVKSDLAKEEANAKEINKVETKTEETSALPHTSSVDISEDKTTIHKINTNQNIQSPESKETKSLPMDTETSVEEEKTVIMRIKPK